MTQPRIYVSIAAFRDPECQHTVCDLFIKASYPERIFVGICWQADRELDKDCFVSQPRYPNNLRNLIYKPEESKGGCWARAEALSMWQGEEYILQIDAHMRFVPGWDVLMIDALERCPTKPSVISTMPPNYDPPNKLQDCSHGISLAHVKKLGTQDELQPLHIGGHFRPVHLTNNKPVLGAFFIGNFMFAPAEAIQQVPFDPHIYFRGQELVYSARLWTHGWDIYQPDRVVIHHYWGSVSRPMPGGKAHYKDRSEDALTARKRVRHLLRIETTEDEAALVDIAKYSMGSKRSLEAYWKFAGINLKTGQVENKARRVEWK